MSKKTIYEFLGKMYHVPQSLKVVILKELELLEMIKAVHVPHQRRSYKISVLKFDPERNISHLYRQIGLF